MITSLANEKVRFARSLKRRRVREREGRFCVEGVRLIQDAWRAGIIPALVFYEPDTLHAAGRSLLDEMQARGVPCHPVAPRVLKALADTATPQGIVAVLPMPSLEPRPHVDLWLILDGIRDPANLGAVLRVAAGAGVGQVWLAPGTVDPFHPKAVRAGMGAHFRVPLARGDWARIAAAVTAEQIWLAEASEGRVYDEVDWTPPSALILGGEATGAGDQASRLATGRVHIPLQGGVESLNVAVAAGVILFEAARQRRRALSPPAGTP